MAETYQLDALDRAILQALMANARTAYAELAKQLNVSPGTVHVRVEKMKQACIITGARVDISPKQLGYDVCCFIGIILRAPRITPPRSRSWTRWTKWWKPITPPAITASLLK